MSDPIAAATKFNEAVESTAVVGSLVTDMKTVKGDVSDMKADVKHIRSRIDNWAGRSFVIGVLISFAASVAVAVYGQPLARAIASLVTQ